MIKNLLLSLIVLVVLVAVLGVAYFYHSMAPTVAPGAPLPPAALPDNSVVAGPVAAISATSIMVMKQDGTTATLSIAADTQAVLAGDNGQPGTVKNISDVKAGMMVLVTPREGDKTVAQTIVLLPAPPAQH